MNLAVSTELFGKQHKVDVWLTNNRVSLSDLRNEVERSLQTEAVLQRPKGFHNSLAIQLGDLQVYDVAAYCWVPLTDPEQVRHQSQLYAEVVERGGAGGGSGGGGAPSPISPPRRSSSSSRPSVSVVVPAPAAAAAAAGGDALSQQQQQPRPASPLSRLPTPALAQPPRSGGGGGMPPRASSPARAASPIRFVPPPA
eukprot:Rhum_TRINITY_DN7172_c0_g1::Rhum_TRINITY_DN7172_c0_g1_i1::g.21976::m.21976